MNDSIELLGLQPLLLGSKSSCSAHLRMQQGDGVIRTQESGASRWPGERGAGRGHTRGQGKLWHFGRDWPAQATHNARTPLSMEYTFPIPSLGGTDWHGVLQQATLEHTQHTLTC